MHADALAEEAQTLDDARWCLLRAVPSDTSYATALPSTASRRYFLCTHHRTHVGAAAEAELAQSLSLPTTVSEPLPSFVSLMLATPFELKTLQSTLLDPWHCALVGGVAYLSRLLVSRSGPQHG